MFSRVGHFLVIEHTTQEVFADSHIELQEKYGVAGFIGSFPAVHDVQPNRKLIVIVPSRHYRHELIASENWSRISQSVKLNITCIRFFTYHERHYFFNFWLPQSKEEPSNFSYFYHWFDMIILLIIESSVFYFFGWIISLQCLLLIIILTGLNEE